MYLSLCSTLTQAYNMATIIECPHLACISLQTFCLNGRWPMNCKACDCKDKQYVEITSSNAAFAILDTNEKWKPTELQIQCLSDAVDEYHKKRVSCIMSHFLIRRFETIINFYDYYDICFRNLYARYCIYS